jgi:large subunit ribosomal protein L6
MVKSVEIKEQKIKIPEQVEITIENDKLIVKGEKGALSRVFNHPNINLKLNGKENIILNCKSSRKKDKALLGTYIAHINNMINGVSKGFEYRMKTVFSHFPIKTSVEEDIFVIQNFLGERAPRTAKILDGVIVEAKGEDITVKGIDKEKVGQTVANIERATRVKYRDIRVFQDGIYRINKGGN